jgi:hypothetical protein
MAFNATFNNISVISLRSFLLWRRKPELPEKTTDLSQVTDKLYHIHVVMYQNPQIEGHKNNDQKKKDKQLSTKYYTEN